MSPMRLNLLFGSILKPPPKFK